MGDQISRLQRAAGAKGKIPTASPAAWLLAHTQLPGACSALHSALNHHDHRRAVAGGSSGLAFNLRKL